MSETVILHQNAEIGLIGALGSRLLPRAGNGLLGWWDFGGSLAASLVRRAPAQVQEVVTGAPTVYDNAVLFDGGAHYLTTDIDEPNSATIGFGGWSADDFAGAGTRPAFIGNFLSSGLPSGLYVQVVSTPSIAPAATLRLGAAVSVGGTTTNRFVDLAVTNLSVPKYFIAIVADGVGLTLRNMTDGTAATFAATDARVPRSAPMLLGSNYSGNNGTLRMTTAQMWNRALTSQEQTNLYTDVKWRASRLPTPIAF